MSANEMPPEGSPCWIEIPAHDVPALKNFYAALFPSWEWKPSTEEYKPENIAMISFKQPSGLSGGIIKLPADCVRDEQKNGVGFTVYFFAESIEGIQAKIHELGGKTCLEKTEQGKNGWYANFTDPEGNRFGTYEVNLANMK
ncbi:hypothetical protein K432DRAFT_330126 [Lepidopterella palustris CBS 459.81]|uniref:Glyoxalase-like domain-containing protein n=1 Tax=Lepidopterella palustris CBS 459.81 TaxID=1314670 RepID=A0A8E2E8N2_9PEZI|nr:hypothetical protein K432DRAFT_330126 [Lepidopterella palustris CBS 459.81]